MQKKELKTPLLSKGCLMSLESDLELYYDLSRGLYGFDRASSVSWHIEELEFYKLYNDLISFEIKTHYKDLE